MANDTKPTSSYTNESEVTQRLQWLNAHRTWTLSHYTWASPGATFTNDSEPSGSYINEIKP